MDYKKDLAARLDQLRHIEGFPIGEDRDILALSDPPHFTACPNPYLTDFIQEHGTPYDEEKDTYHREPYIGDVSMGRNDPILNAHFYHTKVPPKAIEKFIRHYTSEGDVVLDGFGGTGTTGIACNNTKRYGVVADLSPIAAFIGYNQTVKFDLNAFIETTTQIRQRIKNELSWMYETKHTSPSGNISNGFIDYVIWSDIFECPFCKHEYCFWDKAVDFNNDSVLDEFKCSNCDGTLSKDNSSKAFQMIFDQGVGESTLHVKQKPVIISYTHGKKRYFKKPDFDDLSVIEKIEDFKFDNWLPTYPMMFKGENWGDLWRSGYHKGYTHTHHFYTKRNLLALSTIYNLIQTIQEQRVKNALSFLFTSLYSRSHRMNRYIPEHGRHVGPLSGTLYMSYMQVEINIINIFEEKTKSILKIYDQLKNKIIVTTQSVNSLMSQIGPNTIDYIFTDPPFGDNLPYSELNFILESWLKVFTNIQNEAIINSSQNKGLSEYKELMNQAFKVYYDLLKPKRWITVIFHNSKSSVWLAIQEAISKAGFIVSNVSVLDKKKGTTKQLAYSGAVKNDLIINAYKPAKQFEERFLQTAGEGMEAAWIEQFLTMQPIQPALERTEKMLYSKLLAYYIQHGYVVRYDARSFYKMLAERFHEDEGYWFTAGQVNSWEEYKKRMRLEGMGEVLSGAMHLFVSDERSALAWLYQFLDKPKNFSDILTAFNQIANIGGDAAPELKVMLEENFVYDNGLYRRPRNEPERDELSTRRERALLREYERLLLQARTENGKIKTARREALLFGFESCYRQKRYDDILALAKKLDRTLLDGSTELTEFVEAAEIATGGV